MPPTMMFSFRRSCVVPSSRYVSPPSYMSANHTSMQNAGCGHLHHAHCLRIGNNSDDTSLTSCPSGCPSSMFPREAALFDPTPRIVVAWDGDKIDYVPVPAQCGLAQSAPLRLTSDEAVSLIRQFLSSKGFAFPGLFLRIHSRDAVTEYVSQLP